MATAEEFTWSWEKSSQTAAPAVVPTATQGRADDRLPPPPAQEATAQSAVSVLSSNTAAGRADGFQWSWESGSAKGAAVATEPTNAPSQEVVPAKAAPASVSQPGLSAAAYNELLKENLDLRRQMAQTEKEKETAAAENRRLKEELRDLDNRIADSTKQIQTLRKQHEAAAGNTEKTSELEAKLLKAEEDRGRLSIQLGELQAKIQAVESRPAAPSAVTEAAPPSGVAADSDLFRRLQEENVRLKGRMIEAEKERQREREERDRIAKRGGGSGARAGEAKDRDREAQRELDAARERERRSQRTVEQLLEQIPVLERKLNDVEREQAKKDAVLTEKEQELTTLKEEIQRREKRVEKAERMAAMLDSARDQVRQVSVREKRDMHYNMAAVYAREGRYADAEKEYLTALDIDPTDASAHFNLGILYDDELKDRRRAAMHYRRYLKLRPDAPDVDQVKEWLLRTEMGQ